MYRGRIIFKPPMLFTIGFLVTFVIGGSANSKIRRKVRDERLARA